ncbi:hypothetical protein SprV_0100283400 [Sparganum proliferum]
MTSLKCVQLSPANWEDLAQDRPTWRRTLSTGCVIHEANRIAAVKAKGEAHNSHLRLLRNAITPPPNVPTVLADTLGANWSCWTPSDQLQRSECTNRRFSLHLSLASYAIK